MIVGLGLDIAEIDRIEAAITRHGAPFLERLLHACAKSPTASVTRTDSSATPRDLRRKKRR